MTSRLVNLVGLGAVWFSIVNTSFRYPVVAVIVGSVLLYSLLTHTNVEIEGKNETGQ